jgi:hypothetical protein
MKTIRLITAIVLLVFVSCSKEKDPEKVTPPTPNEYIIIGDVEGMRIDNDEKVVNGDYYQIDQLALDVNGDGINDLQFQMGYGSSPGMGMYRISNLHKLHNRISILHDLMIDTTYLSEIVSYQYGGGNVTKHVRRKFDCKRLTSHYEFYSAEEKAFVTQLASADTIWFDGEYRNTGLTFVYEHGWKSILNQNDTLFITESTWKYGCHALPTQTPVYIAFSLEQEGEHLYGWIKLYFNNYVNVRVQEIAIQRKN